MRGFCSKIVRGGIAAASFALLSFAAIANQEATLSSPSVKVGAYEIRNADRGMVKRVKIFHDGERIATIVLRKGEGSVAYCCTADGCRKTEATAQCTTLKVTCSDGVCSAG